MKLQELAVSTLSAASWNPKSRTRIDTGHMKRLVESVRKFGIVVPVIALEDGTIIDGHRRVMAAKELDLLTVPVLVHEPNGLTPHDVYGQVNYAVRPLEGVEHIEVYLDGGPVPNPSQLKIIEEIEGRFGRKTLKRMAKAGVGPRVFSVSRSFISYSELEDDDDAALRTALMWAIETGAGRRLEEAMREGIDAPRLWGFINANKPFTLSKTWTLNEA